MRWVPICITCPKLIAPGSASWFSQAAGCVGENEFAWFIQELEVDRDVLLKRYDPFRRIISIYLRRKVFRRASSRGIVHRGPERVSRRGVGNRSPETWFARAVERSDGY